MKATPILLCCLVVLIFSCKNAAEKKEVNAKQDPSTETDYKTPEEKTIPIKECYLYTSETDTISLNFEKVKNEVSGSLIYISSAKKVTRGRVVGKFKNDTLKASYFYEANETENTEESITFLKSSDTLTILDFTKNPVFDKGFAGASLVRTSCGVN